MRQDPEELYCPTPSVRRPLLDATTIVLVGPHYPENVGAVARAIKTMGIVSLGLVKPGRLATPDHDMAHKMAVRAWDVLGDAKLWPNLEECLATTDVVFATTSHRGIRQAMPPREAAALAAKHCVAGQRLAILFGNEKTGLSAKELQRAHHKVRIPMAGDQPSINLAQAVQLVAYEWFLQAVSGDESLPAPNSETP